jgi:hypothetical protein
MKKIGGKAWVQVNIKEGQWYPHYDIVAVNDLPDSGWVWGGSEDIFFDLYTLIKTDSQGRVHALLMRAKSGVFKATQKQMCYFVRTDIGWSGPVILGDNRTSAAAFRTLSLDKNGRIFAAWINSSNRVVGRWILPK